MCRIRYIGGRHAMVNCCLLKWLAAVLIHQGTGLNRSAMALAVRTDLSQCHRHGVQCQLSLVAHVFFEICDQRDKFGKDVRESGPAVERRVDVRGGLHGVQQDLLHRTSVFPQGGSQVREVDDDGRHVGDGLVRAVEQCRRGRQKSIHASAVVMKRLCEPIHRSRDIL